MNNTRITLRKPDHRPRKRSRPASTATSRVDAGIGKWFDPLSVARFYVFSDATECLLRICFAGATDAHLFPSNRGFPGHTEDIVRNGQILHPLLYRLKPALTGFGTISRKRILFWPQELRQPPPLSPCEVPSTFSTHSSQ